MNLPFGIAVNPLQSPDIVVSIAELNEDVPRLDPCVGYHPEAHRLLVVEDDIDQRETLELLFSLMGYQVETAEDGSRALQLLRRAPLPNLILLDLSMPRMDGTTFLGEIRRIPSGSDIPVFVCSGSTERFPAVAGARVAGCFSKPIDLERLVEAVAEFAR